jgi:hypothetical protein
VVVPRGQKARVLPAVVLFAGNQELLLRVQETGVLHDFVLSVGHQELLLRV